MQILLLGLFVGLFLHDAATTQSVASIDGTVHGAEALPGDVWPGWGPAPVAAIVLGPKLLLALFYLTACMRTRRRLGQTGGQKTLNRLERFTGLLPLVLLLLYGGDLVFGALRVVRLELQHVVLVDEMIVMLPTLLVAVFAWWAYFPVDRRLRESVIFRDADAGRPVYPLHTRGQYVTMQMRHQFGLLLLPLLAVFGWSETVGYLGPGFRDLLTETQVKAITPLGVLGVFLFAPLIIRYVWHTAPLAAGEVRERMLALCELHQVRVRELLIWRTGGGLINAAVTGMISKVRYILLSDGLLDRVAPREVEAVMAHEIAHVRLHHIVWMIVVLVGALGVTELATNLALDAWLGPIQNTALIDADDAALLDLGDPATRLLVSAVPAFGLTMLLFGWVSRRIERQADVFAARHLAQSNDDRQYDDAGRLIFDADSVHTMVHALQRVADLNHIPTRRNSWRHGSIAWRQQHLRSLIGQPAHDTPVDRTLIRVKIAALLAAGLVLYQQFIAQ